MGESSLKHEAILEWDITEAKFQKTNIFWPWLRSRGAICTKVLSNVRGHLNTGESVAIIGSSGSGKTTLLNLLSGRPSEELLIDGRICVNGFDNLKLLRESSSLVDQFHLFPRNTSPRSHMTFHALLRIRNNLKHSEKVLAAERTLEKMGLTSCADNTIGEVGFSSGISGGERRRLGFAVEVLSNPVFLLCDEPTTGLDSRTTNDIITLLKDLSKLGFGILCSIHQPSSNVLRLFDRIILMAEGEVGFMGTTDEALDFFNRQGFRCPDIYNPSDYFINVLNSKANNYKVICDAFRKRTTSAYDLKENVKQSNVTSGRIDLSAETRTLSKEDHQIQRLKFVPWFKQVQILTFRAFVFLKHLNLGSFGKAAIFLIVSLFYGIVFRFQTPYRESQANDLLGACAYMSCFAVSAIGAAVSEIRLAWLPIFFLETRRKMYCSSAYILSEGIFEIAVIALMGISLSTATFWINGISNSFDTFVYTTATVIFSSLAFSGLSTLITCCVFPNSTVSRIIQTAVFFASIPFNTFFCHLSNIPEYLSWLKFIVWQNYAMDTFSAFLLRDVEFICKNSVSNETSCKISGFDFLKSVNISHESRFENLGILFALGIFFRLLQIVCLRIRLKN